jgi:ribosomal-protein-alanine N-acetyltransferase
MKLRRATLADLDTLEQLERAVFRVPWSRQSLAAELDGRPGRIALIALDDFGVVSGFAFGWRVADELHVVSVAVADSRRRQGIGRALMVGLIESPEAAGAVIATLEVRAGNEAAQALYRSFGFRPIALRPRYYPDNQEDAVVMLCDLPRVPS